MAAAFSLLRGLTQEIGAFGELPEKLIIQIVTVGQHDDGWGIQCSLEQMGIENHRQRLAASLSMPEHATFSVRDGGGSGRSDSLPHGEILVVCA